MSIAGNLFGKKKFRVWGINTSTQKDSCQEGWLELGNGESQLKHTSHPSEQTMDEVMGRMVALKVKADVQEVKSIGLGD